jgi:transcription antitermination factor NusG
VQTESQRERVAARFLEQARFKTYLPKILIKQGRLKKIVPLFPGYVFVEIMDRWWEVRWSVGVVRLLMSDGKPVQVANKIMDAIRKREDDDGLVQLPKPRGLLKGDPVRIKRGSFAGKLGVYDGLSGAERSRVLLALLGREVPVLLASSDVEAR